jgi:hypothetical protein
MSCASRNLIEPSCILTQNELFFSEAWSFRFAVRSLQPIAYRFCSLELDTFLDTNSSDKSRHALPRRRFNSSQSRLIISRSESSMILRDVGLRRDGAASAKS